MGSKTEGAKVLRLKALESLGELKSAPALRMIPGAGQGLENLCLLVEGMAACLVEQAIALEHLEQLHLLQGGQDA